MNELNVSHHIPSNLIAAYAAGSLSEAFSLVVACHVSLCDSCRAELEAHEATAGSILEATTTTSDLWDGSLEATLALIEAGPVEPERPTRRVVGGTFPAPLQDYAGEDPNSVQWRSVGGGVRQAILNCQGSDTARLLYIPGGKAVPEHSHRGIELTLVLQGAFSDSVARFARGDVEVGDDDLNHQPIAEKGEPCICLAATEGALKFKGALPRIIQPFIKI